MPKVPGFTNHGNTCYLNAALQVLCGVRCFADDARIAALAGASRETSPVFSAFARLAAARRLTRALADAGARGDDARAARATVVSPMEVKRAVQRRRARFEGFAQHDAHEFMCECLDAVEEEISAAYRDGKIAVERIETTSEMGRAREPEADRLSDGRETPATGSAFTRKASETATPHPTLSAPRHLTPPSTFRGSIPGGTPGTVPLHRTLCPTRRNFTAAVRATLTCDACGDVSERFETFRHLSVDLPPGEAPATLDALLARFFAPESLERRCARDGCEGVCATLARRVVRLPRVLVVHLKRFRFENSPENAGPENVAPRAAKSTRRVVLPETTSLKAFASRGLLPRGPPPRRPPSPAGEAATPAATRPPGGASPTFPATPTDARTVADEEMVADEATAATRWFADDASPSGPDAAEVTYRLRGVVSHVGASIECGHTSRACAGRRRVDNLRRRRREGDVGGGGGRRRAERDWYVAAYEAL